MHLQRVADSGGAGAQSTLEKGFERIGAIEIHPLLAGAGQPKAGQQPRQPEDMIPVHVGDKHPPQL